MENGQAKAWRSFCRELGEVGSRLHDTLGAEGRDHADVNRLLMGTLSAGIVLAGQLDPDRPRWLPWTSSAWRFGVPNPDLRYLVCRVDGAGTYRVAGTRGFARTLVLSVHHGWVGFGHSAQVLAEANFDELGIGTGQSFQLLLGAEEPRAAAGHWIQLDGEVKPTFLLLRELSSDWTSETPGDFVIERLDRPPAPAHHGPDELAEQLGTVPHFIEGVAQTIRRLLDIQQEAGPAPNTMTDISDRLGGLGPVSNQQYFGGEVQLGDDQALVVQADIPTACSYWSVHLLDDCLTSLDAVFDHTSLNDTTTSVDGDGKVRVVISHSDPGTANWLRMGDRERVAVRWRFMGGGTAVLSSHLLALADVPTVLPPSIRWVSPAQRATTLRARVAAGQRRRPW